ncbi:MULTISPECIES: thiamine diphosphokinase [Sutcliffiella]|uniref:Thiamine diphosphokinase n=1 Tax=Sutcliffiella cohnii TaxID=33932 RepID=A0A223KY73_9BACI|nr:MULTISPECIES: thiamine diphosphokinase [Sutcliffiella]AST94343.1 thiamine diphosphokinase [Sutcliffiella cohnii]WBL17617.1 thiamine diphosphokinase [Sutcliffiella sp. NC1]
MNIHIVAGGPVENMPNLHEWVGENVVWVGVDRGTWILQKEYGIIPDKAFGDFDSVSHDELMELKKKTTNLFLLPSEKDEIDTEIAVNWAINEKPASIKLFGGTGGRLDHFFGNIQLLLKGINEGCSIQIIDNQNILYVVKPGKYNLEQDVRFPYISFIPITPEVKELTLTGFKYNLKNRNIFWGETLCISNELIFNSGTFSFIEGILLVIRSQDRNI